MHKALRETGTSKSLEELILDLKSIQAECKTKFGVEDIFSSSKFFESIIANELGHDLIGGFAGNKDAKDISGGEYEYKHYKESSCNHTWTFNDFSDSTIASLNNVKAVIFAHIDDSKKPYVMDWAYTVPGKKMSAFLSVATQSIKNKRKMINVSPSQLELKLGIIKEPFQIPSKGQYTNIIKDIFSVTGEIEKIVGTTNILTSNKLWEVLVSLNLKGHKVLSEQKQFDAIDENGGLYEYKVSKSHSWNFEDISENVLAKFSKLSGVILAVIDKKNFLVTEIYLADPKITVKLLEKKLAEKMEKHKSTGGLRRLQVSLSKGDLTKIGAKLIYTNSS